MKFKHLISTFVVAALICTTYGCKNNNPQKKGNTRVIYELEGGTYQSSSFPFSHYYEITEGKQSLIKEPSSISKSSPSKEGYTFDGWYKTKTTEGDQTKYSDKWDFTKDKVTSGEVTTLYACWKEKVNYSYDIYWINDSGEEELLTKYAVNEQGQLSDEIDGVTDKSGYTFLRYLDENKNTWDKTFKHPGGKTTSIKVYAEYIKGKYTVVTNAKQLQSALVLRGNIYLANDIDMENGKLYFKNYSSHFMGNGYTISNFTMTTSQGNLKDSLSDDNILYISLFGNVKNAKIENVHFENGKLSLAAGLSQINEIVIAPICTNMTSSTIENVTFSATYEITEWPKDFVISEQFTCITDKSYYQKDSESSETNTTINFNQNK